MNKSEGVANPANYAIALDGNGNVYVKTPGDIQKYSAAGTPIWVTSGVGSGIAPSFAVTNSNVYTANGAAYQLDGSTGKIYWTSPTSAGNINQIVLDGAGELYGFSTSSGNNSTATTTRLDPTSGGVLWQSSYPIGTATTQSSGGIAVDNAGHVYVSSVTNGTNVVALKYSTASGNLLSTPYTSPTYASPTTNIGIGLDGMGDAFIIGAIPGSQNPYCLAIGLINF